MILRFGSLLLILYGLGFALFGVTLGKPAPGAAARTDGIVVITGGAGRIEHGVEILAAGHGKRLLVAGTDPCDLFAVDAHRGLALRDDEEPDPAHRPLLDDRDARPIRALLDESGELTELTLAEPGEELHRPELVDDR